MIISKDVIFNKDVTRVEFMQQKKKKECAHEKIPLSL
jgi:hypothetical protein